MTARILQFPTPSRRWLPGRLRRLSVLELVVELLAAAEVRGGP